MKRIVPALVAALAVGWHAAAPAESMTGNELLQRMTSSDAMARSFARGFVWGIFEIGRDTVWCGVPARITEKEAEDIARTFLEQKPGVRHLSAKNLVITGFVAKFTECEVKPAGMPL